MLGNQTIIHFNMSASGAYIACKTFCFTITPNYLGFNGNKQYLVKGQFRRMRRMKFDTTIFKGPGWRSWNRLPHKAIF
jgi:hypothetical protein